MAMLRIGLRIICLTLMVLCQVALAQAPPTVTAEGNQLFCGEAPMPIVTEISMYTYLPITGLLLITCKNLF